MSVTVYANAYRLNFTDGTFLTLANGNENAPTYPLPGQYEMILPNFYLNSFSGKAFHVTKYDLDGNKWEFYENAIVLNNGDLTFNLGTGYKMYLQYDPSYGSHGGVSSVRYTPGASGTPSLARGYATVEGVAYGGDTSGTPFSSFGEALAEGEYKYAQEEILGAYTWYRLENIVPGDKFMVSTTTFYGHNGNTLSPRTLSAFIYWTGGVSSSYYEINLSNSVEEYNPIVEPEEDSDDPFEPGGESTGETGGTGDFDGTSDDINIPSLPTLSAVDTGFITLFNPSLSQLRSLASYMWTGLFDLNNFRKIFADPMDCILGLSIVPVAVPNGSAKTVSVGNISTGISMTTAASQYVEVDCGTINVNEYWGAYLDYDPYTKAEIYLPYIGTHPVATDDIMKKAVTVKYHVDILSGACTAFVKCGGSVLYEFIGQCSSSIPITGNDWTNVINGVINIAGSIGTMVATGGLSAPISAGQAIEGATQLASGAMNSMKPAVEKSAAMGGTGGMLAVQTPYLILTRPRQALPKNQNAFMGYPSFVNKYLGYLSGYTEIESIHLDGIPATDPELQEIETLLKKGVIF